VERHRPAVAFLLDDVAGMCGSGFAQDVVVDAQCFDAKGRIPLHEICIM
jgi:hypothetical protein